MRPAGRPGGRPVGRSGGRAGGRPVGGAHEPQWATAALVVGPGAVRGEQLVYQ